MSRTLALVWVWHCLAGCLEVFNPGFGPADPRGLLVIKFMTEPLDLKINGSSLFLDAQPLLWNCVCHQGCEKRRIIHLRRQTPHVDTSNNNNNNNKIFLVEMLSYRPSELEEHQTHLY